MPQEPATGPMDNPGGVQMAGETVRLAGLLIYPGAQRLGTYCGDLCALLQGKPRPRPLTRSLGIGGNALVHAGT